MVEAKIRIINIDNVTWFALSIAFKECILQ
jgi:hypothetical protein